MATPGDPATPSHQACLDELRDTGMRLARAIDTRAAADPETLPDMAAAFDRVSRAVRRTILLAQRLDETAAAGKRAVTRRRIIRAVEDAIEHRAATDGQAGRLTAELNERLDAGDLDDDICHRPDAEIIADICRDLGLEAVHGLHLYKRRTPADIALLCARAARPPRPVTPEPATSPGPNDQPERVFRTVPTPKVARSA